MPALSASLGLSRSMVRNSLSLYIILPRTIFIITSLSCRIYRLIRCRVMNKVWSIKVNKYKICVHAFLMPHSAPRPGRSHSGGRHLQSLRGLYNGWIQRTNLCDQRAIFTSSNISKELFDDTPSVPKAMLILCCEHLVTDARCKLHCLQDCSADTSFAKVSQYRFDQPRHKVALVGTSNTCTDQNCGRCHSVFFNTFFMFRFRPERCTCIRIPCLAAYSDSHHTLMDVYLHVSQLQCKSFRYQSRASPQPAEKFLCPTV